MLQCCEFGEKFEITRETQSRVSKFGSRKRDVQDIEVGDNELILMEMSTKWPRDQGICLKHRQA